MYCIKMIISIVAVVGGAESRLPYREALYRDVINRHPTARIG